jgi:hypothetical protein
MPLDASPIKPAASVQQPAQGRRGNRQREQQDVSHVRAPLTQSWSGATMREVGSG